MNFSDAPVAVQRSLYDDAVQEYASRVMARAEAVYLTGNIHFPGLSDLDMVVVTSKRRADNSQFFSAMDRLPVHFGPILLHEPFVIPANHKNVLQYGTHRNLKLIAGNDVLSGVSFLDSAAERWCKILEAYCSHAAFFESVQASQQCRGRRLIAKGSSLRFALRQMDQIFGSTLATHYEEEVDSIRAHYFSSEPVAMFVEMWARYKSEFDGLTASLRQVLPLERDEGICRFARRLFAGRAVFDQIPAEYTNRRSLEIDRYHQELFRLNIPFGQIFFWEAHGARGQLFRQGPVRNRIYRAKYKLQRILAAQSVLASRLKPRAQTDLAATGGVENVGHAQNV